MSSATTNFGLHKIDLTDAPPDITVLNPNWDLIDGELKKLSDSKVEVPNKLFPDESTDPTRTVYLSPSGDDSSDGSIDAPMKTLRGAIAKYGGSNYLKLYLNAGEYTDNSGEGRITISACSFISIFNATENVGDVTIKVPLYFRGVPFYLENITFDVSGSANEYCVCSRSASFACSGCVFNGYVSSTYGVLARYGAVGYITNCEINNCLGAVRADTSGVIFTTTLSSTVTNTVAYSTVGGLISITADNLLATTTYSRSGSGAIFMNGSPVSFNYGTTDLTAGTSALDTGTVYYVYE